jgi:uracil-DNA glycosylase family 4
VTACQLCPRLRDHCQEVARVRRRAYREQTYWGRPVPGFGDPRAWLLIVGLAPAAHGANRTGRMFTGDRSGDFLYAALHRAGLASQPHSVSKDDGLQLSGVYITAPCRCAPPENQPLPEELARCRPFLTRELALLTQVRVVLALGAIGFRAYLGEAAAQGCTLPVPAPRFGHGVTVPLGARSGGWPVLLASYHVSQQNTQTGKLTPAMFDEVLARARTLAGAPASALSPDAGAATVPASPRRRPARRPPSR